MLFFPSHFFDGQRPDHLLVGVAQHVEVHELARLDEVLGHRHHVRLGRVLAGGQMVLSSARVVWSDAVVAVVDLAERNAAEVDDLAGLVILRTSPGGEQATSSHFSAHSAILKYR